MKKKVSRIMVPVLAVVMMMTVFAGCEEKTKCEWCEEMKHCETVYLSLLGEYNMCEDCKALVAPISDNLKELDEMENGK